MPYNPEILILLENSDWENHIPKRPIFYEELHIEDDDGTLVENGEQQELDIETPYSLYWEISSLPI